MFEIAKTSTGYASTPTVLASFNGARGRSLGGLIADAPGTFSARQRTVGRNGGRHGVRDRQDERRLRQHADVLVSFNGADGEYPVAGLIADAAGDLFGTTESWWGHTTVARCSRSPRRAPVTPARRLSWRASTAPTGRFPPAGLIADAAGDLFGTTKSGGANGDGTVFEIAKTSAGYASTPTVLASFNGADGTFQSAGLIADAAGDLFGTTE